MADMDRFSGSTYAAAKKYTDSHAGPGGDVTKEYVDQQDALKVDKTSVGVASGVAELDSNGKVPSSQLPSYVDDVIEGYYKVADGKFYEESTYETEITSTEGKIYVSLDTDKCYRWGGSEFVEISESLALGETSSTAYAGNKGKANADAITDIQSLIPANATAQNKLSTMSDITGEHVELTQAQYDALSYAEKHNGKVYFITDADVITIDSALSSSSENPVQNKVVNTAITAKTDKVTNATNGNFAGLDNNGNITDSGKSASDFAAASHTQASNTITAMTGYSKPASTSAIATTDTLNEAIGKLEKGLDDAAGGGAGGVKLLWEGTVPNKGNNEYALITINELPICEIYIFVQKKDPFYVYGGSTDDMYRHWLLRKHLLDFTYDYDRYYPLRAYYTTSSSATGSVSPYYMGIVNGTGGVGVYEYLEANQKSSITLRSNLSSDTPYFWLYGIPLIS